MIDTTHQGFPDALPEIRVMPPGNLVAMYDTGSPNIMATAADLAQIPNDLQLVMIDQGFTGSPNPHATVRDCENGAWQLSDAVKKGGWFVPRPTLYLGFPDTAKAAFDLGWRGDVWLVHASDFPPAQPPAVPDGLNVVAVQWNFKNPGFDRSVVFDDTWPRKEVPMTVTIPDFFGKTAGEVHNEITKLGLVPRALPGQRAIEICTSTEPAAGTLVTAGTVVMINTTIHQTVVVGKYSIDMTGTIRLT